MKTTLPIEESIMSSGNYQTEFSSVWIYPKYTLPIDSRLLDVIFQKNELFSKKITENDCSFEKIMGHHEIKVDKNIFHNRFTL